MTAVIEAASAGVKDMADGSLRITFEFEPRHAAEAFALFGPRGRAVAVAALKDGAGAVLEPGLPRSGAAPERGEPSAGVVSEPVMGNPIGETKPRREQGDLEMKAILWCKSPEFWKFLTHGGCRVRHEAEAKALILSECDIESRRQLDAEPAKSIFLKKIVGPFYKWNLARGLA